MIVGHAALSPDCRLVLVDGKQLELGLWRDCAETFVGPSITDAIDVLKRLRSTMDQRYERLLACGRRKITADSGEPVILVVFDELAYFSATVGDTRQQKEFTALLRDLVARGRAAGIIVVAGRVADRRGRHTPTNANRLPHRHRRPRCGRACSDPPATNRGGRGMTKGDVTLTPAVLCPRSRYICPHTWVVDTCADLIGYGQPDLGLTVRLGRCRYCGTPLLSVESLTDDGDPTTPYYEITGAEL